VLLQGSDDLLFVENTINGKLRLTDETAAPQPLWVAVAAVTEGMKRHESIANTFPEELSRILPARIDRLPNQPFLIQFRCISLPSNYPI